MRTLAKFIGHCVRLTAAGVFSVSLWAFWLALTGLLVVQLYIVSSSELAVPQMGLRRLENWLAESGLKATFGRTSFDPTGRVLIENASLFLPAFGEPIVAARSIFIRFRPLALISGRFEPEVIRLSGASAFVPAMLSPSGRPEEIVHDLDLTFQFPRGSLQLEQLSAVVAGAAVTAHGPISLPRSTGKSAAGTLAETFAREFPGFCRQAVALTDVFARIEEPSIQVELLTTQAGALGANVTALGRSVKITAPFSVKATNVRARTQLLPFGDAPATLLEISADELWLPQEARARGINAQAFGRFGSFAGAGPFDLRELDLTVESLTVAGHTADALSARLFPRPLPKLGASVVANVLGAPLAVQTEADLSERNAVVRFAGSIAPAVLDIISSRVGTNIRRYYDFESLTAEQAEARFGAGWKFEKLTAQVRVPRMLAYGVDMQDGRVTVELEPGRIYSPYAFVRVGENHAHGTYEHDLTTNHYRFLLEGQLRPLAISPWFRSGWWENFFKQMEFPEAAPFGNAEVIGGWKGTKQSVVFLFADSPKSIVRGTDFDHVRTRLFIRPSFVDGLEGFVTRGEGSARGTFTLVSDPTSNDWQKFDLSLSSNLDLATGIQVLGPKISRNLSPFQLANRPEIKLQGTFFGPAAPQDTKDYLKVDAHTTGDFRFHHFPLQDAAFVATLDGDEISIDNVGATFAGGLASGHARVWGSGDNRRLGFDMALQDASLGLAVGDLQEFLAIQNGLPAPPKGTFVREKANVRLDLAASGEGKYDEPLSFRGEGNASLRGAEIGEVAMLGLLSDLLKFTTLRFTEARANFKIDTTKLLFRQVELRGANSTVDAHGEYSLDKKELDFNAKIYPFHESGSLIKSVVGAVLTPLSNAFEVKLTGSMEKPHWAFALGPTNLLKSLAEGGDAAPKNTGEPAPAPSGDNPPLPIPTPK